MNREGSATLMVLSILLFLSAMFIGVVSFLEMSTRGLRNGMARREIQGRLRDAAKGTVDSLMADPTPFADSSVDPVWEALRQPRADGITVHLEDLSSRLGLNWVRKEILADTGALLPGRSAKEVQEFREAAGLRLNPDTGFGDFFRTEALPALFTTYGWFNINITDEFVLRSLHFSRGNDKDRAEEFHAAVQKVRIARRTIGTSELADLMGEDAYGLLFPVVNAEPAMNIHFVPARVVEVLFKHFELPPAGAQNLLEARQAAELTPGDLNALLGGDAARTPLSSYIGLHTWFWRITAEKSRQRLTWVISRVPREDGNPEFRLVEERFQP